MAHIPQANLLRRKDWRLQLQALPARTTANNNHHQLDRHAGRINARKAGVLSRTILPCTNHAQALLQQLFGSETEKYVQGLYRWCRTAIHGTDPPRACSAQASAVTVCWLEEAGVHYHWGFTPRQTWRLVEHGAA